MYWRTKAWWLQSIELKRCSRRFTALNSHQSHCMGENLVNADGFTKFQKVAQENSSSTKAIVLNSACCSLFTPCGTLLDELCLTVSNFCTLEHAVVSPSFCHWFELNLHVASLLYCRDSFKSKCFSAWLGGFHDRVGSQKMKTVQCCVIFAYVWKGKRLKTLVSLLFRTLSALARGLDSWSIYSSLSSTELVHYVPCLFPLTELYMMSIEKGRSCTL